MPGPRRIAIAACILLLLQAVVIGVASGSITTFCSDATQISIAILCIFAALHALRRSSREAGYHWRWLIGSFCAWVLAQALGTYIDISSNHFWDRSDDVLFFLSSIPGAMLLFLDPDQEHTRFDRLHVLDFMQVSGFWVSVYLFFARSTSIAFTTVGWTVFGWTSSIVFNGVLTLSFLLRATVIKSTAGRIFFGGMAAYMFFAGLADSYAALASNDVQPGHWFDMVWSLLLCIPLVIALTWNQNESLAPQSTARAQRIIVNQFFPLVYPFFSILLLVQDARWKPVLSSAIALGVFVAVGVRVLIIQHRLLRTQDALEFEASHDALTGIWNRASIFSSLGREVERQKRTDEPLALLLADIDHFKAVNDTYGHMIGDQVLVEVARRLAASVRIYDSVGRYGGEEFMVVVPTCDSRGAMVTGERLRCSVADFPVLTSAGPLRVSISLGFVSTADCGAQVNHFTMVKIADRALYVAKENGRNRVEGAVPDPDFKPSMSAAQDAPEEMKLSAKASAIV